MDYRDHYDIWLSSEKISFETRAELLVIQDNDQEINERFNNNLEFGTGGLRGKIGVGTSRINIYTVRKATQGLANFINEK